MTEYKTVKLVARRNYEVELVENTSGTFQVRTSEQYSSPFVSEEIDDLDIAEALFYECLSRFELQHGDQYDA